MILKASNSAEWLKEVERRVIRIQSAIGSGNLESAQAEARELVAASQILYGEVVNEKGAV